MPNDTDMDDDISKYIQTGTTLKPDDIEDHSSYTVVSWRRKTWDDGNVTYYLKLAGLEKEFRVNKTNAKKLGSMYGLGMNGWIGKSITLFVDKVKSPNGGLVDSIIVSVRRDKKPTAVKPKPEQDDFDEPIPF